MNIVQKVKDFLIIILGNLSLAVATSLFILPNNIVNGGTSAIALILESIFDFNSTLIIFILNWSLFIIGTIFLGKSFSIKTLLSTILYPSFIAVLSEVSFFSNITSSIKDMMLVTLIGAILAGFGLGIVYRVGASTGGLDVISLLFKKYCNVKISFSTCCIDTLIILLGMFTISIESSLYGLICVVITSYVIEKITVSGTRSYMAHIVSDKCDEINNYLINVLERGTTLIYAEGGLTKKEKKMIEVVFNEKEYYDIKKNIYKIDNKAFISVYQSINAYGEGFEEVFIKRR